MTSRDEQIAEIRRGTDNLRPDRLKECYDAIKSTYDQESIIASLAHVVAESDRTPSNFRVLSNSETRRLTEFNDNSYHWDHYCKQLGRSIVNGERTYLFEKLDESISKGQPITIDNPSFSEITTATNELISAGFTPDVVCIPIHLFVGFMQISGYAVNVDHPGQYWTLSGGKNLKIHWSGPLDNLVVYDTSQLIWKVKPDPFTGHRLTVAIGEPDFQPRTVRFIAETIAQCEILDPSAFYSIPVETGNEGAADIVVS